MLRDSIGGAVARSALMNELQLRRMEAEIAVAEPKSRGALYDQQAKQTKEYREAIDKLQKMFPELAVAGKVTFKGTISDLTDRIRTITAARTGGWWTRCRRSWRWNICCGPPCRWRRVTGSA